MDSHRCINLRLEHRFRTLDRTCRSRRIIRYGHGPLGDSGMDDTDTRMGLRALLHTLDGIHHARVPGATLQQAEPHHTERHLAHLVRAHQGRRDGICRRTRLPAGLRHQGALGHRLLLDCSHRTGAHHRSIHHLRRHEERALHQRAPDTHPAVRLAHHTRARTESTRQLGPDAAALRRQARIRRSHRHHDTPHAIEQRPAVPVARSTHRLGRHRILVLVYRPVHRSARTLG